MKGSSSVEEPLAFFERVSVGFERAAGRRGEVERFYRLGGCVVRLRFAGEALVEGLASAFDHLRIPPQEEFDLCVGVWDSASTRTPLAPPPWTGADHLTRCGVRGYEGTRVLAFYEQVMKLLTVLDCERDVGFFYLPDAALLPAYQVGSPLLLLLHAWMEGRGRSLVHGGAVGTYEGGVLLVGKGGSGKSTTALCCLHFDSPLLYAGDDYALVSFESGPTCHSLYSSGKVHAKDVDKFPRLAQAHQVALLDTNKALYLLHPAFAPKLSAGFPLRALVIPRVSSRSETRFFPASKAQALLALAPSTLFQLPGAEANKFARLSALAREVPAFVLETGSDWAHIPLALSALIHELNARS